MNLETGEPSPLAALSNRAPTWELPLPTEIIVNITTDSSGNYLDDSPFTYISPKAIDLEEDKIEINSEGLNYVPFAKAS